MYSWRDINEANTKWGTVAYLQLSVYGSHENIRINNNSDYKTGYSLIYLMKLNFKWEQ